jgi:hypothetical protein
MQNSSNRLGVSAFSIKPNTTYTISSSSSGMQIINYYKDSNQENISNTNWVDLLYTFTTPSNCYYNAMLIRKNDNSDITPNYVKEMQLEKGSKANSYTPYGITPIELNSSPDGTIRDQIIGKPNEWYKREYIGKVVLDGVTNKFEYKHTTITSETKGFYRTSLPNKNLEFPNGSLGVALSDYFGLVSGTANNAFSNNESGMWWQQTGESVYFILEKTSLDDANDWLTTHNTTIYYPLAQYTDIPITNTTLINQLNDIYNNAHSYNGETNITTTYEDGNEQMYLDIEALAKGGSTTTETDPVFSASASAEITSSDISNWNNKADVEDIPDLTDYVKNTNFASSSKGGVIKVGNGNSITAQGILYPNIYSYANYQNLSNNTYIGKGTLENVITGKNLADKNYVDTAIATAITNTLGGSF